MSDERIEAAARAIYHELNGDKRAVRETFDRSPSRDRMMAIATVAIDAAAALGRERVREAGIDEQALEAACGVYTDGRWGDVPYANYYGVSQHGMRAAIAAYLTAAPPERHDAPGVSEFDFELDVLMQSCIEHGKNIRRRLLPINATQDRMVEGRKNVLALFREAALTGQPDAAERNAPGVSVPADMLLDWRRVVNFAIQQVEDEEWQSQLNGVMRQMSELTRGLRGHAVYPALTGQPDAGRDPDAGDDV